MLPILDIQHYLANPNSVEGRQFVTSLLETCHGPGFFYLTGHQIAPEYDQHILEIASQFFDLPTAEREEIAIGNSPHFRGYTLLKNERTNGKVDWRDQIDVGPEESAPDLSPGDPPWNRLRGPNQWPKSLPSMPGIVNLWMDQMQTLGMVLMRALAEGLELPSNYFDDRMSPSPYNRLKISRYPAQPEHANSGQGLGLHHDSGIMTFILQDATPGLQVMSNGDLIDVTSMPGAYIVNLGEMMQSATDGFLKATKHQVVSPPPGSQRLSVAFFLNPRLDAKFAPITLPPKLAAKAAGGQNANPDDPVFHTFGQNTLKIRMRSHPDVTEAFYADVDINQF